MKPPFKVGVFVFVFAFAFSIYGALVLQRGDDDYSAYVHKNIFQDAAEWAALPGDLIATLIINPTDIPERNPDPWTIRYYTGFICSVFWTVTLYIVTFIVTAIARIMCSKTTTGSNNLSY